MTIATYERESRKATRGGAPYAFPPGGSANPIESGALTAEAGALTPHQARLLQLLADGHNFRRAAVDFGVSVNTIAFHAKRIYERLDAHSRSEAVAKALRHGLIR
jgi:DNA-binding CsgD family transcriptional regulator